MAVAVETAVIQVVVGLAPRTKKNHGQLVTRRGTSSRPRMFPSKAWTEWAKWATIDVNGRRIGTVIGTDSMVSAGNGRIRLWHPLTRKLNCAATFYRDRTSGDAVGYYQGLADLLEKRGIVANDSLIVSWDGSRLAKDATNPRTELILTDAE